MMGDDDEVYKSEARTNNLAFDLFRQGLRRLTFRPGLDLDEVEGFVRRFAECRSAEQIDEDFVTMMWQDSSSHIEIIAIEVIIIIETVSCARAPVSLVLWAGLYCDWTPT